MPGRKRRKHGIKIPLKKIKQEVIQNPSEEEDDLGEELPPPGWVDEEEVEVPPPPLPPPPKVKVKRQGKSLPVSSRGRGRGGRGGRGRGGGIVPNVKVEQCPPAKVEEDEPSPGSVGSPPSPPPPPPPPTRGEHDGDEGGCFLCGMQISFSKTNIHRGRVFKKQVEEWKYLFLKNGEGCTKSKGILSKGGGGEHPCESCFNEFILKAWNISEEMKNLQEILKGLFKRAVEKGENGTRGENNLEEDHNQVDKSEEEDISESSSSVDDEDDQYTSDSDYDPSEELKLRKTKRKRTSVPRVKSTNNTTDSTTPTAVKCYGRRRKTVVKMEPPEDISEGNKSQLLDNNGQVFEPVNLSTFLQVKIEEKPHDTVVIKQPLIVPGYEALCSHCGTFSRNLENCEFCRTRILDGAKIVCVENRRKSFLKSELNMETLKFPEKEVPPPPLPPEADSSSHNIKIKDVLSSGDEDEDSGDMPRIKIVKSETLCGKEFY